MKTSDVAFLMEFMKENKKSGQLTKEIADKVELLWKKYAKEDVSADCAIIDADFGFLGSLVIRSVKECEDQKLKYESGSYDYVSVVTESERRVLWTDYLDIEPYNRNSGLYCSGASFSTLGLPVFKCNEYREFDSTYDRECSISFGVWGFWFNDFYRSIKFGISINKSEVDEFVSELRQIIGKNH